MPEKNQTWEELMDQANASLEEIQRTRQEIDAALDHYGAGVSQYRQNAAHRDTQIAQASTEGLEQIRKLTADAEAEILSSRA